MDALVKETDPKTNYTVEISHDDHPYDFWEDNESVGFISNHKDYSSQNTLTSINDVMNNETKEEKEYVKVFAYIHSGIALSVERTGQFNDRFDSGVFGFIEFSPGEFGENNVGVERFVSSWNDYLSGNIYCLSLINEDGECVESMGGLQGYKSSDYAELVDNFDDIADKDRISLKSFIEKITEDL